MSLVTKKNIPGSGQIVKGFGDDLGFDGFDPEKNWYDGKSKLIIPPSGQVKGFGDDLGIDTFDPEGIPSTGKIQNTMNPMSSNNIIIPPSGQIQASGTGGGSKGAGQLLIPESGQIMGGGYTPGSNYGDDPGIDEVRPARPGTVSGGKMNKKIVPKSGQIIK